MAAKKKDKQKRHEKRKQRSKMYKGLQKDPKTGRRHKTTK